MGYDGIVNARGFNNSYAKKKKGNKQGKFKQNKVNVRKEEKICQVKKEQGAFSLEKHPTNRNDHEGNRAQGKHSTNARKPEPVPTKYNNKTVSWMNNNSIVGRSDQHSLTSSKDFYGFRNSNCGSSCSSSCSGEDRDDRCLDDWEAMADALTAENSQRNFDSEHHALRSGASSMNYRAWSPNDVYRPRSLPSITRGPVFSWRRVVSHQPPTCPICCDDFDSTDSSFIPCPCGFRLCLFCHKTIIEVDGRCPGCRKQYDSVTVGQGFADERTHSSTKNSGF